MRPAITEVRVFDKDGKQRARIVGPIDFEEATSPVAEHSVYLWVRVAPVSPHRRKPAPEGEAATTTEAAEEALASAIAIADAEGAAIGEAEETVEAVGTAELERARIHAAKKAVAAASDPAMWSAVVAVKNGHLTVGDRVFVEVWALVRTVNRQREFQIYWYDDDVPVVQGTLAEDDEEAEEQQEQQAAGSQTA
jgi:hypothetical protein